MATAEQAQLAYFLVTLSAGYPASVLRLSRLSQRLKDPSSACRVPLSEFQGEPDGG
jgi:hypothetical protein